jgi:hypothetical protein
VIFVIFVIFVISVISVIFVTFVFSRRPVTATDFPNYLKRATNRATSSQTTGDRPWSSPS